MEKVKRRTALAMSLVFLTCGAVPAFAYDVYVTNERDNSVSVIDSKTFAVTRTFPVGRRPRGLVFSKDGKKLFVCASDSDAVQVIAPDTGKLLHDLPSGEDPEQFALAPDGHTLFIANENNAATTVIDADTRKVLAQIDVGIEPEGMAVSPSNKIAVTTSETTNMVHWIDVATLTSNDATPVGQRPRHAEFNKDGSVLWVSSEVGGTVAVIDVASKKVLHTIDFAIPAISKDRIQPVGISLTRDGKLAFVALGPADRVAVVDARTYEVKGYILVGRRVWHLAFTPDEDLLLTTNGVSGDVTAIDVASQKPVHTVKVGRFPWGVAVRPDQTALPRSRIEPGAGGSPRLSAVAAMRRAVVRRHARSGRARKAVPGAARRRREGRSAADLADPQAERRRDGGLRLRLRIGSLRADQRLRRRPRRHADRARAGWQLSRREGPEPARAGVRRWPRRGAAVRLRAAICRHVGAPRDPRRAPQRAQQRRDRQLGRRRGRDGDRLDARHQRIDSRLGPRCGPQETRVRRAQHRRPSRDGEAGRLPADDLGPVARQGLRQTLPAHERRYRQGLRGHAGRGLERRQAGRGVRRHLCRRSRSAVDRRNLLGETGWKGVAQWLAPGDHALLVLAAGPWSPLGEEFVLGSIPDRVAVLQNGLQVNARDLAIERFGGGIAGMPAGQWTILKITEAAGFDPARPWNLSLRVTRERGQILAEKINREFATTYSLPADLFVKEQPDAGPTWVDSWKARWIELALIAAMLALLVPVLIWQKTLVANARAFALFRYAYLAATLGFIGWYAQAQLSIVTLVGVVRNAKSGNDYSFLLYDPPSLLIWGFVLVTLVIWGRGTFCGWLCPFGALQELVAAPARWLRVPQLTIPPRVDRVLRQVKYVVLAGIVVSAIVSTTAADELVEVEPFKTGITLYFVRYWPFVAYAVGLLALNLFVYKGFCRYLCPLGASLALVGRLRIFDWIPRRAECGSPCQLCKVKCRYGAIEPSGAIDYPECFQCMDCVTIILDPAQCVPEVLARKKGRRLEPKLEAAE